MNRHGYCKIIIFIIRDILLIYSGVILGCADEKARKSLRKATHRGRPAGGEIFIKKVEQLTGRFLEKGKVGRPKKTRDIN